MDSPETWRWVWLAATVAFVLGEMTTAGAFFLLPFGIGAGVATVLAFLDVTLGWQWTAFVGVSAACFAALRPLARRLDQQTPFPGVGADRWTGRIGTVISEIPADPTESGLVKIDREEWRAQSAPGASIAAGTQIRVVRVEGTRVIVEPITDSTAG